LSAKPRQRRGTGSLSQLKSRLWSAIEYNTRLLEDETADHELRLKGSNALVQSAMAYLKASEAADIMPQLERLERAAAHKNSHYAL
jgi:hypothetical protein